MLDHEPITRFEVKGDVQIPNPDLEWLLYHDQIRESGNAMLLQDVDSKEREIEIAPGVAVFLRELELHTITPVRTWNHNAKVYEVKEEYTKKNVEEVYLDTQVPEWAHLDGLHFLQENPGDFKLVWALGIEEIEAASIPELGYKLPKSILTGSIGKLATVEVKRAFRRYEEDGEPGQPNRSLVPVIRKALNHVHLKFNFSPGVKYKKWKLGLDGIQQFEEVELPRLISASILVENDTEGRSIEPKTDIPTSSLHEGSMGTSFSNNNKRYQLRLIVEGPGDINVVAFT
jgi:hypothetical protein